MITIDLTQGFGKFSNYELFKFPDNSIKFKYIESIGDDFEIITSLRTNDDIITLMMVKDVLDNLSYKGNTKIYLTINYMMYQQDDRRFDNQESFGLKIIANLINSLNFTKVAVYHPHSDMIEMINNCVVISNMNFVKLAIESINDAYWVIPDSGAYKSQFKQIEKINYPRYIVCNKSRDFLTGKIHTDINVDDLKGKDCFIVDDICLGGRTFLNIAEILKAKNVVNYI